MIKFKNGKLDYNSYEMDYSNPATPLVAEGKSKVVDGVSMETHQVALEALKREIELNCISCRSESQNGVHCNSCDCDVAKDRDILSKQNSEGE